MVWSSILFHLELMFTNYVPFAIISGFIVIQIYKQKRLCYNNQCSSEMTPCNCNILQSSKFNCSLLLAYNLYAYNIIYYR